MTKLSFAQYLHSKQQLRESVGQLPRIIIEYEVRDYAAITLGETVEDKEIVALKPKQLVVVEWEQQQNTTFTPIRISFEGHKDILETEEFQTFWPTTKLRKWLTTHTINEVNRATKV